MKNIDTVQLDALLKGAQTIEEDGLGLKVARLCNGDFLKLYRRKRLLSSDLWDLPAKRFADNAHGLQKRGIQAPQILDTMCISERRLSAVRYLPLPGETLRSYLQSADECSQAREVERFGAFLGKLHESGVYFRSLHLGNVLLLPDHSFGLIDLSDMKLEQRALAAWKRRRNLQHILRYAQDIEWLADRHRAAWLKGYASSVSSERAARFQQDLAAWQAKARKTA